MKVSCKKILLIPTGFRLLLYL